MTGFFVFVITVLTVSLGVNVHTQNIAEHYGNTANAQSRHQRQVQESEIDFEAFLSELESLDPNDASTFVVDKLTESLKNRISGIFSKATSSLCRAKIAKHFSYFINSIGNETSGGAPFSNFKIKNTCPESNFTKSDVLHDWRKQMSRTWQPPRDEAEYIDHYENLILLYGILMHGDVGGTLRLIEALDDGDVYDSRNIFVVHVDGKEENDKSYIQLMEYAKNRTNVHIVSNENRVSVNWGGYSMVNATIQILRYSFGIHDHERSHSALFFHKFILLSATHYPIKSNSEIREKLSQYPIDANFMQIVMKPTNPTPSSWHYFVECDDAIHRIYRLPPLNYKNHGVELYTGSQWFVISRNFAKYIADQRNEVAQLIEYSTHMVVADEHFFSTLLRNSEFCTKHVNKNFNYLQFDRWESDLDQKDRDGRKCLLPDQDKCGRSPTEITTEDFFALELSDDLFARKFRNDYISQVKDLLDKHRSKDEELRRNNASELVSNVPEFEGEGVLIVALETVSSSIPLCLGLHRDPRIKLVPCFHPEVVATLSEGWETGAVIAEEVKPHVRWRMGPCNSNGNLLWHNETGRLISKGIYSSTGPHCLIKQYGGSFNDKCLDFNHGRHIQVGGQLTIHHCTHRFHQMFAFGNGACAPVGSIHLTVPSHSLISIRHKEVEKFAELCLGVAGRGSYPIEPWNDESIIDGMPPQLVEKFGKKDETLFLPSTDDFDDNSSSLIRWNGKIMTTVPCTDEAAVIDFVFVPFITESDASLKEASEEAQTDSRIDEVQPEKIEL